MARRSLLPSPPHLPTPGSPASSPATPLLLRPLRSLGEIPRPRRGTTCGIALRRPSSSRATAAEPRAARAGRPQRRAPPPGPPPHTNDLLRPPISAPAASRVGAPEKWESRACQADRAPFPLGSPGNGGGPALPSPAGLCFVIPSPLTPALGCASDLWGQAAETRGPCPVPEPSELLGVHVCLQEARSFLCAEPAPARGIFIIYCFSCLFLTAGTL